MLIRGLLFVAALCFIYTVLETLNFHINIVILILFIFAGPLSCMMFRSDHP